MIFRNARTGAFGVGLSDVALALRLATGSVADLVAGVDPKGVVPLDPRDPAPSLGDWAPYREAAAPSASFGQEAYEVAPVAGVQQWALRDSTQPLTLLQAQRVSDVAAYRAARVAAGFVTSAQVIDIDDAGRADLTSMMAAANASLITVLAGTATWPSNYATGWVTRAGGLLQLPKATDGIKLATAALNYYSGLIQREAALKKAINAVASLAALRGIDITAGWPAGGS